MLGSSPAPCTSAGKTLPPLPALFPLPVPRPGVFDRDDPSHGKVGRGLLLSRVLHVTVMALNFLHADLRPIPTHVLQKPPSTCHAKVFERLELLIRACSRSAGPVDCVPLCAGRRGAHLVARLGGSPYPGGAKLGHVGHHGSGPPALQPYRDSDASRILIKGTGSWDLGRHLRYDPELCLPFRDPLCSQASLRMPCPFRMPRLLLRRLSCLLCVFGTNAGS